MVPNVIVRREVLPKELLIILCLFLTKEKVSERSTSRERKTEREKDKEQERIDKKKEGRKEGRINNVLTLLF